MFCSAIARSENTGAFRGSRRRGGNSGYSSTRRKACRAQQTANLKPTNSTCGDVPKRMTSVERPWSLEICRFKIHQTEMSKLKRSAIRNLSAPYDGPRFDCAVRVQCLCLGFEGPKADLRIRDSARLRRIPPRHHPRGDICTVASWTWGGIACYDAVSGEVISVRDDLKQPQRDFLLT